MKNLIPRKIFFENPDRTLVRLSPNGDYLSFIAPLEGVLNIWIADPQSPSEARCLTNDTHRGIRSYAWVYDNTHILYVQDTDGDEDYHIYALDIASGNVRDLTPFEGIHAQILKAHRDFPGEVLVGLNHRRKDLHDVYRLDISSGALKLLYENDTYAGFTIDDSFALRLGVRLTSDGGSAYDRLEGKAIIPFTTIGPDDAMTTSALSFKTPDQLYWIESRGRDTSALYLMDLKTNAKTLLVEDNRADLDDILIHPITKEFEGAAFHYLRKEWVFEASNLKNMMTWLLGEIEGDLEIVSRTASDHAWIVAALGDRGPVQYYWVDPIHKTFTHLFSGKKSLEGLRLVSMHPQEIPSRDGLFMVSYLTLPLDADPQQTGKASKPVPFVLLVHGGPNARDSWGYNALHQWLANRGYGVLSVNYRGSTGFGKKFIMAGNGEWSRKMHDDLIDATHWLVDKGYSTKEQIAIMGGSYGGYATLVGLTFTPDVFACGVDIVGPSNLKTLMETIPAYWKPALDMLKRKLGGDLDTPEGLKELADRSPITRFKEIKKPLLIGQGAHDPRVKQAEADQIADALVSANIPVTYILYPDEGHGFARPENRLSFYAITEAFLAQHLGGVHEPIGSDFQGSSLEVVTDTARVVPEVKQKQNRI